MSSRVIVRVVATTGEKGGLIAILTDDAITRTGYTEQATCRYTSYPPPYPARYPAVLLTAVIPSTIPPVTPDRRPAVISRPLPRRRIPTGSSLADTGESNHCATRGGFISPLLPASSFGSSGNSVARDVPE